MIAGVHLDLSNIGWDALVAIATLALAGFTWRLARRTADLAKSTAGEVQAGLRPVLILAASDKLPVVSPGDGPDASLRLSVYNAGRGPALNAYANAVISTSGSSTTTRIATVGNVAPGLGADVEIAHVPSQDEGDDADQRYYTAHVRVVYQDLGGRLYYTVIGLSDPADGGQVEVHPHTVGGPWPRPLRVGGTQTGEGEAPPPQWRVTYNGPDLRDDQRERMAAAGVLAFGAHGSGSGAGPTPPKITWWTHSAFSAGARAEDAISAVQDAIADDRFVNYHAAIWSEHWDLTPSGGRLARLQRRFPVRGRRRGRP